MHFLLKPIGSTPQSIAVAELLDLREALQKERVLLRKRVANKVRQLKERARKEAKLHYEKAVQDLSKKLESKIIAELNKLSISLEVRAVETIQALIQKTFFEGAKSGELNLSAYTERLIQEYQKLHDENGITLKVSERDYDYLLCRFHDNTKLHLSISEVLVTGELLIECGSGEYLFSWRERLRGS
jgi:hypothetical protein